MLIDIVWLGIVAVSFQGGSFCVEQSDHINELGVTFGACNSQDILKQTKNKIVQ